MSKCIFMYKGKYCYIKCLFYTAHFLSACVKDNPNLQSPVNCDQIVYDAEINALRIPR